MNQKLLVIAGLTATGKTSLGIKLAKEFNGEIISADSRQIYRGMDIGTGKDIPKNLKSQISDLKWNNQSIYFYLLDGIKIWGYDLVNPNEDFSVADFKSFAEPVIKNIIGRKKLPIVVGGTGLYLDALTKNLNTIGIPPNLKLRKKLYLCTKEELQQQLKKKDPKKYLKLNPSDRHNPRRLVRALEISLVTMKGQSFRSDRAKIKDVLWIGLKTKMTDLYQKIDKRVEDRLSKGAEKEIKTLLKIGYSFNLPSFSAIGYRQWEPLFKRQMGKAEVIERWKLDEHAYARRQLTWFKKNKKIFWFDVSRRNYEKDVVKLVSQWYSG